MKTISVSTPVYALIWGQHREGDENEDDILRRILSANAATPKTESASEPEAPKSSFSQVDNQVRGFEEPRYDVRFEEGEEIFRSYKGKEFRASATGGYWLLHQDQKRYPSLHKLSWAIVNGHENAWNNWKVSRNGRDIFISSLRNEEKIQARSRPILSEVFKNF